MGVYAEHTSVVGRAQLIFRHQIMYIRGEEAYDFPFLDEKEKRKKKKKRGSPLDCDQQEGKEDEEEETVNLLTVGPGRWMTETAGGS